MRRFAALTTIFLATAAPGFSQAAPGFSQAAQPAQQAGPAPIYPDSTNTPGEIGTDITQENLRMTVCNRKWTGVNKYTHKPAKGTEILRPPVEVTDKIKAETMKTYGFTNPADDYELDHFISLELGGCPDCVTNLWPQAYGDAGHPMTQPARAAWNRSHPKDQTVLPGALEKDKVEDHLKTEMCAGTINLARAQEIIGTDWYSCYLTITGAPASDCR
jgi:hypothetical protein